MNIITWHVSGLDVRTAIFPCYLNIGGETYDCKISHLDNRILISSKCPDSLELVLYQENIFQLTESLYYFETWDSKKIGSFYVPEFEKGETE